MEVQPAALVTGWCLQDVLEDLKFQPGLSEPVCVKTLIFFGVTNRQFCVRTACRCVPFVTDGSAGLMQQ